LYEIIKLGGDTDTNADIALGVIGALVGKNNIP
jgi:ADP-ribosylglycohydrolase